MIRLKNKRIKKTLYPKLFEYFIGDLQQPMRLGRKEDFRENDIRLKWLGKSYNFHRLWDINLIDSYVMYYGKLTYDVKQLSFRVRNQIFAELIKVWIAETQVLAMIIYKNTPP